MPDIERRKRPAMMIISEWAMKIIPPLIVAAVLAICGGAWATYMAVEKITNKVAEHDRRLHDLTVKQDRELDILRANLATVEANSIKRAEILEMMKRIEQQLEIALLRSGVKVPPKSISGALE